PEHALHQLGRPLTMQDLRAQRHIVVRESGTKHTRKTIVDATQRWTVSNNATQIQAVRSGYGFAWFPEDGIREELQSGALKPLPLRGGGEMFVELYMVLADPDSAGPGLLRLTQMIRDAVAGACREYRASETKDNVA